MLPAIAFPFHDPDLEMFPHLQAILPDLKTLFRRAYICPPLNTRRHTTLMDLLAKEVDWLAREDPFVMSRDPEGLKRERENSPAASKKRLSYARPMVETLVQYALKQNSQR